MSVIGQSAGLLFRIDAESSGVKKEFAAVDASITSLGSKFSSFGGVATVAAAGVAAIGAAALTAGKYLFDLTSAASEFGSEIYDASQKTGLSATAISSLKAAAEQSGSSLEAVTKGIAKFAKQYEGTSTDLRAELAKTFKQIADAKPGFEQLTLAQEKFGKSGADLIPMINSFDGDLEGLIKRMEDLGITIDDEAAAAADAFGDQMDVLSAQLAGVGRTIGTAFMPQFTRMAASVSNWLVDNKQNISTFATVTSNAFRTLLLGLESVAAWVQRNQKVLEFIFNTSTGGVWGLVMSGINSEINRLSQPGPGTVQEASGGGRAAGFDPDKVPGLGRIGRSSNRDGRSAQDEADRIAERNLRARIQIAENLLTEFQKKFSEAVTSGIENITGTDDDSITALKSGFGEYLEQIQRTQKQLQRLQDQERATMTDAEKDLLTQKQRIAKEQVRLAVKKELLRIDAAAADFNKEEGNKAQERIDAELRALEEKLRLLEKEDVLRKSIAAPPDGQPNADGGDVSPYGPFRSWIDGWKEFVKQFDADAPTLGQSLQTLGGMFVNAFQGMAQAMGGVVQQWVLMGSTGPAVMRKILASALASIAAEAAVRAIWELALGFATLFTNPSESAGHFIAAALFGSVAVGAGLAGRAIAGDAFKQQAQAATGSTSSATANSGQGSAGKAGVWSSKEDSIIERGRNAIKGLRVDIGLKLDSNGVLQVIKDSIRTNGSMRDLVVDTGY